VIKSTWACETPTSGRSTTSERTEHVDDGRTSPLVCSQALGVARLE